METICVVYTYDKHSMKYSKGKCSLTCMDCICPENKYLLSPTIV